MTEKKKPPKDQIIFHVSGREFHSIEDLDKYDPLFDEVPEEEEKELYGDRKQRHRRKT